MLVYESREGSIIPFCNGYANFSKAIAKHEYGIDIVNELPLKKFDACIAAVAHKEFENLDVLPLLKEKHVIFDVKCTLDRSIVDVRL